jgi:hypothetical protein
MYITRVPNRNSPPAVLLRESYREGSKTKNRTLANLSQWPDEKVEARSDTVRVGRQAPSTPHASAPTTPSSERIRSVHSPCNWTQTSRLKNGYALHRWATSVQAFRVRVDEVLRIHKC